MERTGLARATPFYDAITTWDIGSVMAALYSARILGFLDDASYHARMQRTLATLRTMPLFQDAVFNKIYDSRTARLRGAGAAPSSTGYAWSATDLGRLLVWLSIVGLTDSTLREDCNAVVHRIDFARVVAGGYLYGQEEMPSHRTRRFQEGRIGYEQYAAHGFALWGQLVGGALDLRRNADTLTVLGVSLLRDRRGLDRLTSEPFILLGLELGWSRDEARLARGVLAAQEQRFRRTGIVTMASEDAVDVPPQYFYYYCVYCSGKAFVIDEANPGRTYDSPRWVSTKTAFAWQALLPSVYTQWALRQLPRAWSEASGEISTGVYEKDGASTRTHDINVAAVVLEAAAYRRIGRPLLYAFTRPTR